MSALRQRGFSLVELMISLAILTIVIGVVMDGIMTMQKRNAVEVSKVDLTQQAREFMDQIVNDIHQAGYPGLNMFDPATMNATCTNVADVNLACGLVSVTTSTLQFEGDVDGTGVSEVYIELIQPQGGCPCTLRRGTVTKAQYQAGTTPLFYTEVDNVMNTAVFTAYLADGTQVTLPASAGNGLKGISAIGITLYVKASQPDLQTGQYPTVTMVATAKISNIQSL
ncbi:MAG TPA: prepilin-type N-terminal cleavage/methylation domain-containing protein [Candidatus Acidoferrales bacterium]|jgi:prepilin-type N-terminal cleavage/methylation domain-containing protein|nr:prepilin-type N-terminal cleavage/methylation domain-containing protein [Candidatus Acidoferrales bacterium]